MQNHETHQQRVHHIQNTIDDKARIKAAWLSLFTSIIVLVIKTVAFYQTRSAAILSDALETIVNVVAAIAALFIIRAVAEPADEEHPYGHGKLEFFSAAFEGGLIFSAALMIVVESIKVLLTKQELHQLESGLVLTAVAAVFNLVLGLYLKKVGEKEKSQALKASSAHVLSDVYTTVGVFVGLGLVLITGWTWLDPLFALFVGINLAYEGYKIVRQSIGGLIDEVDLDSLKDLAASFQKNKVSGIIDIHELKVIRSGKFHHIDAHLVIPEHWDIAYAHEFSDDFESNVVRDYPFDGEIAFHLDPCRRNYCSVCDLQDCPVRKQSFKTPKIFTAGTIIGGPKPTDEK